MIPEHSVRDHLDARIAPHGVMRYSPRVLHGKLVHAEYIFAYHRDHLNMPNAYEA
jgi:hypothetical protein